MAEGTRLKELSVDMKKMQEQIVEMEAASSSRMERLEKLIESMTKAPNTRVELLESFVESLTRAVDFINRNSSLSTGMTSDAQASNMAHNNYQPFHLCQVKLDFPIFDGIDPLNWLFRAEQFFNYYETSDAQRITIAAVHMDGMVVPWFQMMQKAHQIPTWRALARAIEDQFGPSRFESPRAQLFKMTQTDSATSYFQQFMMIANVLKA